MKKVKLYCAGQFSFDYLNNNYYDLAKDDYRAILLGNVDKLLNKSRYVKVNNNVNYIGPFYFESDGMIDRDIVNCEVNMIKKCSDAIFLLDNGCCPGTISELILATSLHKNIAIFYIKKSDYEETESTLHSPCWFPIIMSDLCNSNTHIFPCNSYCDAVSKIIDYVKNM